MPAKARDIKKFQLNFLQFLREKNVAEVHIYHHVMNYWSNDSSLISLQSIKEAITDLCNKKFIVSKNNSHLLLGAQGVPEEEQKNLTFCSIQQAGISYIKKQKNMRSAKNLFVLFLIIAAIFSLWHFRNMIIYFFK